MYAGLTIADKGALLDAQAKGWDYVRVKEDGSFEKFMNGVFLCEITVYHIPTALAQIAELEREKPQPLTCDGCRCYDLAKHFPFQIVQCSECSRQNGRTDRYEPKGESK